MKLILILFCAYVVQTATVPALQKAEVADLAFLVDITGSMQCYIDGTKDAIQAIVDSMDSVEVRKLRLAFVGYRDFGDNPHFEILPFTDPNDFRAFLGNIRATGGGDTPEDVFGGLEKIGNLNWDAQAGTRVLLHIADSPCHGSEYHNGGGQHPEGDPEGRSLSSLMRVLNRKQIDYNFGRIRASSTDQMIQKFSDAYGQQIPQFDIQAGCTKPRPCRGIRCCVPIEPFTPPPYITFTRFPVRRLSKTRFARKAAVEGRVARPICPPGTTYVSSFRGGDSGAGGAEASIASGSILALRKSVESARARLGS